MIGIAFQQALMRELKLSQDLGTVANIVQSPCIRHCCLNDADICLGCFRSLDEITRWSEADNHERIIILQNSLERRDPGIRRDPEAR